jgi:hypothetical protein
MPDGFDISQDFSDPTLINALHSKFWLAQYSELLARLRKRVMVNRTALEKHAAEFNKAYEEEARGSRDADGLEQLAEKVLEAERGAAEQLHPWMEALRERLAPQSERAQEAQQYLHELYDFAVAWLATYQTLRERLLKLAVERRDNSRKALGARPVEGDIDYVTLTREIVARFPKILAALAK